MFTFDSKHIPNRCKIRAQQEQETFVVVNRRQFGAYYIPVISFHSQAPHVQGHFEIWKQVFTLFSALLVNLRRFISLPDLFPLAAANRPWVSEDGLLPELYDKKSNY